MLPQWVGVGADPYQLTGLSPVIDAGQDHLLTAQLADKDLDGHDRICDGSIDLGAYEFCGEISGVELPGPYESNLQLKCTPNPFNPRAVISFNLEMPGPVVLKVFDVRGHMIVSLADGWKSEGTHLVKWDGTDNSGQAVSSGVYFCQISALEMTDSMRLVLLR